MVCQQKVLLTSKKLFLVTNYDFSWHQTSSVVVYIVMKGYKVFKMRSKKRQLKKWVIRLLIAVMGFSICILMVAIGCIDKLDLIVSIISISCSLATFTICYNCLASYSKIFEE